MTLNSMLLGFCFLLSLISLINAEFEIESAKKLMKYFKVSHCSEEEVLNWNCEFCDELTKPVDLKFFSNSTYSVKAYGGVTNKENILLVFNGDDTSFLKSFGVSKKNYEDCESCQVASKFYDSYSSIKQKVMRFITRLKDQRKSVTSIRLVGHGMGCSLALLAFLDIKRRNFSDIKVKDMYLTGCPRLGNKKLAEFIEKNLGTETQLYRITKRKDPVVHTPSNSVISDFFHVGQEIFFPEDSMFYKTCVASAGKEPNNCSQDQWTANDQNDHDSYYGLICNKCKKDINEKSDL